MSKQFGIYAIMQLVHLDNWDRLYHGKNVLKEYHKLRSFMIGRPPALINLGSPLTTACQQEIRKQHPELATFPLPPSDSKEDYNLWLAGLKRKFGDKLGVSTLPTAIKEKIIIAKKY